MKINIGTKNRIKIEALGEILQDYPHLQGVEVSALDVDSGVSDEPKSLDESVRGAMNRARAAFQDCLYSFGLESGLMAVPNTKSGFMDVCVCAIFDGQEFYLGLSSAWEAPLSVTQHMVNEGMDMNQAALKAGLTNNPIIGHAEGVIGIMTKGRLTRKEYTKQAIRTALIHLDKI